MKVIMLPLTRESNTALLSEAGAALAAKFSAHVTGLFIRRDPKTAIPLLGEGLTADMIQQMCDVTDQEGQRYASETEVIFVNAMAKADIQVTEEPNSEQSAHWRTLVGEVADHVGRSARTADFSICERPGDRHSAQAEIFNDLVFRSGRSVLMVPDNGVTPTLDHMLIAWNGRAECARAVGGALPLLRKAKTISVLQVGNLGEDRPTLKDIGDYLKAHGVDAKQIHEPASKVSVGETVYGKAQELEVDSIVIGAFSTARWRELILGGVTRHLIENSDIPIYMSH